jgi:hypothetical protein
MEFPIPLPGEVKRLQDGLYTYRGLFLRFNRMEQHAKWTAHYRKAESVDSAIDHSYTIRGIINEVDLAYADLAAACGVPEYLSDEAE